MSQENSTSRSDRYWPESDYDETIQDMELGLEQDEHQLLCNNKDIKTMLKLWNVKWNTTLKHLGPNKREKVRWVQDALTNKFFPILHNICIKNHISQLHFPQPCGDFNGLLEHDELHEGHKLIQTFIEDHPQVQTSFKKIIAYADRQYSSDVMKLVGAAAKDIMHFYHTQNFDTEYNNESYKYKCFQPCEFPV